MAAPDLGSIRLSDALHGEDAMYWERLQYLFQYAAETLLGDGVYMGRSMSPTTFDFCNEIEAWQLPRNPDVWPLLEWLGDRGRAWTHGSGGFGEGVNGWLDPDESWLLAGGLGTLPLPSHPATLDAIRRAREEGAGRCTDQGDCPRLLAALRSLAEIAAGRGQGLLWARDVFADGQDVA